MPEEECADSSSIIVLVQPAISINAVKAQYGRNLVEVMFIIQGTQTSSESDAIPKPAYDVVV